MKKAFHASLFILLFVILKNAPGFSNSNNDTIEAKVSTLLEKMTLDEKIGQMVQVSSADETPFEIKEEIRKGLIGSILNQINVERTNELQRLAVEESRLGIPLILARDVIHGFRTIFPIPLAQAATWNPTLVKKGARVAAVEAASVGIRWTFAPMMDISRDPRWGRIAESLGEDPYLTSILAAAMVEGFQGDDLSKPDAIAACAKHFAGYGASEGGRDYNSTFLPENLLRNVYLPPFKAAADAGAATFMSSFNDNDGIPATASKFLLRKILRDEWGFQGFVVSDWSSITEMVNHGFCADEREAALKAVTAGVNMEMVSSSYREHLKDLIESGELPIEVVDEAVKYILRVKFELGLFENPYTDTSKFPALVNEAHLKTAKEAAVQSIVMLKNHNNILPLSMDVGKVAVVGSLANDKVEQLGTWIFDGRPEDTRTARSAIQELIGKSKVNFAIGTEYSRSKDKSGFSAAIEAAQNSDVVLLFLGEEAILSGEAHSRADISLPGVQKELLQEISKVQRPIVLVLMAGRPLTFADLVEKVDAILYAWHPGTMGGPAIAEILFGLESPSGKIPVTFPKEVGQIPLYYNHNNTGRPANANSWVSMDSIAVHARQFSDGSNSNYMDIGSIPLFPFGFGLSYTDFVYENLKLSSNKIKMNEILEVSADVTNTGKIAAAEIVQLYTRDIAADISRPIKELRGFQRISLKPGEKQAVVFKLKADDLAFYNSRMEFVTEPGLFHVWIAKNSQEGLMAEFEIIE